MDIFLVAIQLNSICVYKVHTMPKLAIRYTINLPPRPPRMGCILQNKIGFCMEKKC